MTMQINGTSGLVFNDASTQNTAATGFGFKNRILNGAMMIDQRNAGASVNNATSANTYIVDRFAIYGDSASKVSGQRSTTTPTGFVNSVLLTSLAATTAGANDFYGFRQNIEGFNVSDLGWGTANAQSITLSFWVRSSLTGTFSVAFSNNAANRAYVANYVISVANTWEQKTVTIAGDTTGTWTTDNTTGIALWWDLGSGSNRAITGGAWSGTYGVKTSGSTNLIATNGATFYITGVQLEKGSTATSFDYRPYGTELALCQRYYETNYPAGNAVGSSTAAYIGLQMNLINPANGITYVPLQCNVQKRANATWTVYTYSGTSGQWHYGVANATETSGAISVNNMGDKMAMIYLSTTPASDQNTMYGRWVASAEL